MGSDHRTGRDSGATPRGLAASVMRQIRVLRRDVCHTLQTTNLGTIRIAARIVAVLARDTARMVPRVRVALGRSTDSPVAGLRCSSAPAGPCCPGGAV